MGREVRRGSRSMADIGVTAAAAAGLTWLLLVVAARTLGPGQYAHFMVIWGTFFTITGVLQGLQQEVTRSVTSATPGTAQKAAGPLVGSLAIGLVGGLAILATSPAWGPHLLGRKWLAVGAVLAAAFAAYAVANMMMGAFAARQYWRLYAWAIGLEGILRCVLILIVLKVGVTELGWVLALSGAVGAWLLLATGSEPREVLGLRGDSGTRVFVVQAFQAMLAASCSALLVAGFPVLLRIFDAPSSASESGVVLAVVVVTRAPTLLMLNAYQGPLIARLVSAPAPARTVLRWMRGAVAPLLILCAVAALVGPRITSLVFGADFQASWWLVAGLVLSGGALGALTLTGWAALARARHSVFLVGWVGATVVTTGLLAGPGTPAIRSLLALTLGPLTGVATHVAMLEGHHLPRRRHSSVL